MHLSASAGARRSDAGAELQKRDAGGSSPSRKHTPAQGDLDSARCLLPLFPSTLLTLALPSPLAQTHKAPTKNKKEGLGAPLIKTTV